VLLAPAWIHSNLDNARGDSPSTLYVSLASCLVPRRGRVIGRQLLRAGTGAGSHYRAACRARSDAEFISKLGTAIEETDETAFWLEVLVEAEVVRGNVTKQLYCEADELTRIFVASRETTRRRMELRAASRRGKKA
jgi:four helix bundle protein